MVRMLIQKTAGSFCPEAEFWDIIGPKVLRVFLLAIHSHLLTDFNPPLPLEQKLFETGL
jgi:hypothetical protein